MFPFVLNYRKKVLVTGFSAFNGYETNPSWEGVNAMDCTQIESKYDICLIRKQIAVIYEEVDKVVPLLWKNLRPHLTIHVGVSAAVSCFVLETQASNYVYYHADANATIPKDNKAACDGPDTLVTQLDVADICRKFNSNPEDELQAKISSDAGRYLCEYIYYTSLCHGRSPTLFVHVPLEKYTTEQLARGLERILVLCLKQLSQDDYYSYDVV